MSDFGKNGRGIAAMLVASAGFILNDSMVKFVSQDLPIGQIVFMRGFFACLLIGTIAWATGALANPKVLLHPAVLLRASAETCASVFYLAALAHLPIANATAILQALPLMIVAASALFLGEHVGWRRWGAVLAGFCGVLLIVRPGFSGFSVWSLSAIVGVTCMSVRDLATRAIPAEVKTFAAAFASVLMTTCLLGPVLAPFETWVMPAPHLLALLVGAAVFLLVGFVFIIIAVRTGDMVVVAPFRYSIVIWAIIIGFLVWGDVPDWPTLAGITLLIATGIYAFFRERALAARGED
ncbi:drug/metabolite transporter (DMT)-like permease [Breoghania corrubedonensis]|uniref:Drug/metabolite transporter (DMT)-like permease n=1 Tax=Breoghania corrubedonensis TaxID=665038 RepID=A0A2T5VAT1_9HYPH|nr:DMT family transporter [Breoghania corrubedonensis]PTW60854.1 drug/metabolite transporter (DMT)-like permease [Breoghania corrubedonensis]